ncbi:MAG TPA: zf-TFIIB domain-containing protein [Myxococcales bacterium]
MDCPRDNTEMTELSDGEERVLFRCAECGGLWVEVADLNRILLHAGLPTLEAMGGRANPEEDAGECPVDNVALLAVESAHKRNPLIYETCESCGGIWLESADFAEEGESAEEMIKGIVDFYREFAVKLGPGHKAARK